MTVDLPNPFTQNQMAQNQMAQNQTGTCGNNHPFSYNPPPVPPVTMVSVPRAFLEELGITLWRAGKFKQCADLNAHLHGWHSAEEKT